MKKFNSKSNITRYTALMVSAIGLFACGNGGTADADGSMPGSAPAPSAASGDMITLAVKFVNFTKDGKPVVTDEQLQKVMTGMNKLYEPCKIQFKTEESVPVNPADYGLDYAQTVNEMDKIRAPFDTDKALVVINTGPWDQGSMGSANAWTAMPGSSPSGAVMESDVADNTNIVAHEIGHYISLDHESDQSNLMNPVIYPDSTALSATQCEAARHSATTDRVNALR